MVASTRSKQGTPEVTSLSTALEASAEKLRPREGSRTRDDEVYDAKYSLDLATTTTHENVFLFYPNLIGYVRVILAAASLYIMPHHPNVCSVVYGISALLDAVDGQVARAFGQTSKFGAVLDMVTDRCTTACLLTFLASTYPNWSLLFMFLITLDFSSHYIHMYASLTTGSSNHKAITSDVSRILWYYYNDARTLFVFCMFDQLFFVCLYLNAFIPKPIIAAFPLKYVLTPDVIRSATSSAGPLNALIWILQRVTWPQLVGGISAPICLAKQGINAVQFWKASKILVGVDLAERAEKARRRG